VNSVLLNAFVDFGKASNPTASIVYLLLTTDYTGFRGQTGSAAVRAVNLRRLPPRRRTHR
jgi:hypothetical protein